LSIKTSHVCNICKDERKEANHWFVVREMIGEGILIRPWQYSPDVDDKESIHLCGQTCVHSFIDRYLAKSLPKPEAPMIHNDTTINIVARNPDDDIPF
jgi:hypothetical protein